MQGLKLVLFFLISSKLPPIFLSSLRLFLTFLLLFYFYFQCSISINFFL
nr:MAG TPA: hypothetical protein [Caudoviricetes sp.]DAU94901.1 MAG TPA: hypothetical protein [Caudoviricetes sp.]